LCANKYFIVALKGEMNLTILEQVIFNISVLLSFLAPIDNLTEVDTLQPDVYPHVYIVPQHELALATCGCPCEISGAYLGKQFIGGYTAHTIVMGGVVNKLGDPLFTPNDKDWQGVLFHELDHHRQFLNGDMEITKDLDDEALEFYVELMEEKTYQNQNQFLLFNRMPTMNVEDGAMESTQWAAGETVCKSGVKPIPNDEKPDILDLVEFYDMGLIEIYRNKYH
jgi:hypothetical protein